MLTNIENSKGNTVDFFLEGTMEFLWRTRMMSTPKPNSTHEYDGITYKVEGMHYEHVLRPEMEIAVPPGGTSQDPYCDHGIAVTVSVV